MIKRLPLFVAFLVALPGYAEAQVERAHAAHVHGRSQIDLVYESGVLELSLLAPGMDIVGFEHVPASDADSMAIEKANALLEAADTWLAFEPAGSCTITGSDAHAHGYRPPDEPDGHDGHDHGERDDDGHGHAEFHARIKATCSAMPAALQVRLHDHFPGLGLLRIDMITDAGQNRIELARGHTRVPLSN